MSITTKTINNNEYIFVNTWRGNRSGFVHETKLYKNNALMSEAKCQYYNRTWECYDYQTVMKKAVYSLIDEVQNRFVSKYKAAHNIKRLTKTKRAEMEADFAQNTPLLYVELGELYSQL